LYTVCFSLQTVAIADSYYLAPAESAVSYRRITVDGDASNKYKGSPSRELDKAWLDLLHGINIPLPLEINSTSCSCCPTGFKIRVTAEELDMINRTSTDAEDGHGGFLATLDLFHHLHCIVRGALLWQHVHIYLTNMQWNVRHFLAPDYYREQVDQHITEPGETYPTHIG
jgi:hypothetical protein